eukprot:3313656-Pleurochrysis_carterae.AAC.1
MMVALISAEVLSKRTAAYLLVDLLTDTSSQCIDASTSNAGGFDRYLITTDLLVWMTPSYSDGYPYARIVRNL